MYNLYIFLTCKFSLLYAQQKHNTTKWGLRLALTNWYSSSSGSGSVLYSHVREYLFQSATLTLSVSGSSSVLERFGFVAAECFCGKMLPYFTPHVREYLFQPQLHISSLMSSLLIFGWMCSLIEVSMSSGKSSLQVAECKSKRSKTAPSNCISLVPPSSLFQKIRRDVDSSRSYFLTRI